MISLLQFSWITFPSHQFPVSSSVIGCVCTKDLVRSVSSDTTCPLNVQAVKSISLPEAHYCTTAPGPQQEIGANDRWLLQNFRFHTRARMKISNL